MFCIIISANCFVDVFKNDFNSVICESHVCEKECTCTFCSLLVEIFKQGNEIDEQGKNPSTE